MLTKVLVCLFLAGLAVGFMDNCRYHEFDCDSHKKCIPFEKHCDGYVDCEDKSDEATCVYVHSTLSPKSRRRNNLEAVELNEKIEDEESFGFAKIVIVAILVLLVSCLVGLLGFLYKKNNFWKPKITSFNNPIYHETTENANKESEEMSL